MTSVSIADCRLQNADRLDPGRTESELDRKTSTERWEAGRRFLTADKADETDGWTRDCANVCQIVLSRWESRQAFSIRELKLETRCDHERYERRERKCGRATLESGTAQGGGRVVSSCVRLC